MADAEAAAENTLKVLHSFRTTQVMYVIAKLGLADLLAEAPLTANELSSRVGVNASSLARVLRFAAYCGLVSEVPGGRFELTELGRPLCGSAAFSVKANAVMLGEEHYGAWGALLYSVKTGESAYEHVYGAPFFEYMAAHPDAQAAFDAAMSARKSFGRSLGVAYDFSKARVVVDVGGGNGSVAAMILEHNPGVEAVVYDQAQVLEAADRYLSAAGLRSRCRLEPGDFFESVPAGGDLYVLSNIVHDWDDMRAGRILRNCHRAMAPSSVLLLIEVVMPEHGRPSPAAMQDVNMMVLLTGRERTEKEYESLLGAAAFRLAKVYPLWERESLIEARPLS